VGKIRAALDRTARENTARFVAELRNFHAVELAAEVRSRAGRALQLEEDVERLEDQRDSARDQIRELRERAERAEFMASHPPEIKLSIDALPDIAVTVKPSPGVEIVRDDHGNVTGTRPRTGQPRDKVALAVKKTQAGQSLVDVVKPPEIA